MRKQLTLNCTNSIQIGEKETKPYFPGPNDMCPKCGADLNIRGMVKYVGLQMSGELLNCFCTSYRGLLIYR